ncbi:MAG: aldehyde dehydrogenase family protein [Phycisphaerales bacterium]|nr:aldehyde dehydrogenase family protein [Phycisphaerales bacterium]
MPDRLEVTKTYKLFIDGKFPRSESGRSLAVKRGGGAVFAHLCHASRKDLRDAVVAARKALPGWSGATAYLRGQILYRIAEMMEGKRAELAEAIGVAAIGAKGGRGTKVESKGAQTEAEVAAAIDRLVAFAGWADKYAQVLGCNNAVAGPYYNFTVPEPTGVVAVVAPDSPALLGLISLIAPAICAGNTVVALASEANPIPAAILGEVIATSDVPAGVVNILTGTRAELVSVIASHRDIDAVHAASVGEAHARTLREGAAENVKRVCIREDADWFDAAACSTPWWIEPMVEMKTMWHPSAV